MIKDLIADKKKVDEDSNAETKESENSTQGLMRRLINRERSTELAKGISVATKLIEDEIKYWEGEVKLLQLHQYGWHREEKKMLALERAEDRIKYLKSLLENSNAK